MSKKYALGMASALFWNNFGMAASPLWRVESSASRTYSAQIKALENLEASQNALELRLSYRPSSPLLWLAQSRPALGLRLAYAQTAYLSRTLSSQGVGFQASLDAEWKHAVPWEAKLCLNQRLWSFRVIPEAVLVSRLATGSYAEVQSEQSNLASASVSTWTGFGGWGLRLGLERRLTAPWLPNSLSLGLEWELKQAYFQQKTDIISARAPTTGVVTESIEKTPGSFVWQSQALSLNLSYPL